MPKRSVILDRRTSLLTRAVLIQAAKCLHRALEYPEVDEWDDMRSFMASSRPWINEVRRDLARLGGQIDDDGDKRVLEAGFDLRHSISGWRRTLDLLVSRMPGPYSRCRFAEAEVAYLAHLINELKRLLEAPERPPNDLRKDLSDRLALADVFVEQRCPWPGGTEKVRRVAYYRAPNEGSFFTFEELIKEAGLSESRR